MPTYLTPGLYYETVDLDTSISAVRTDVAAFIGIASQGPLHTPTPVSTWAQFQSMFGNFIAQGYLAYAVKAFFENGGRKCWIVRVAAQESSTLLDTAAAQPADGSSSFVDSVDGFVPGAVVTVVRDQQRQSDHILDSLDPVARQLFWLQPLEAMLLGAPLTFLTGPSAAAGQLLDAAGVPTVGIQAASAGTWGNALQVRAGHSSLAATVTSKSPQPVGGVASLVQSVTGFPVGSLVRIFQDQSPTPVEAFKTVALADPALKRIAWDTPLPATFNLTLPMSLETREFSLSISVNGQLREIYSGLSLAPAHPKYVETINAASNLISVTDLLSATPFPDRLPDPAASNLTLGVLTLRAGRDGIAGLRPPDFAGDPADVRKRGIATLEDVDEPALVAVPDILIQPVPVMQKAPSVPNPLDPCSLCPPPFPVASLPPPALVEPPPSFTLDQIFSVQQALVSHCEKRKDRLALLDPPIFSKAKESVEIAEIQGWRQRFDSKYAALYFPWVRVYDPLQLNGNVVRDIPPSGHAAGNCAYVDLETGVHRAPANVELSWIQDVTVAIDAPTQGILNPAGINCIRAFRGRGLRINGARTVSSEPAWRFVNVRRLMMMIEKSLDHSLQWSVFEPNSYLLRQNIAGAISSFLEAVYEGGGLAGATEADAFYVKCDATNNPPELGDAGQLVAEVGVAPVLPAEFVVVRVGITRDGLEITE